MVKAWLQNPGKLTTPISFMVLCEWKANETSYKMYTYHGCTISNAFKHRHAGTIGCACGKRANWKLVKSRSSKHHET